MSTSKRARWSSTLRGRARRAARRARPARLHGLGVDRRAGEVPQLGEACRSRTVRPARMMLTRSQSASTSARMWLDSSTVRPSAFTSSDALLEDRLHQRVEPGRRLVEQQQLDVGRERRRPARPSAGCPWSRCGAFFVGSSSKRSSSSARRVGSRPPRSRPSRSIDLAAGEVGPQGHVAGHVGEPAVQRRRRRATGRRRAGVDRRRRRRAAGRAAPGSWWTCRRRSARGSRAPRRAPTVEVETVEGPDVAEGLDEP